MKYYSWLFLTSILLTTSAQAFESKIEIFEQFDGLKMVAFISEKDINKSPEWNPDIDAPSLTVAEAIKAARDFNKAFNKAFNSTNSVKEIELRPMPNHIKHWHYLVKIANDAKKSKYDIFVVLMNGQVIPAIIEPESYK